jgi:hypothetical protein
MHTDIERQQQILADELAGANTHYYFGKKLPANYHQPGAPDDFQDYTFASVFIRVDPW